MAFAGFIRAGRLYVIELQTNAQNPEVAVLAHGWTSPVGSPPRTVVDFVAPAGTQLQSGTPPGRAEYSSLVVDVDLPDAGGMGRLVVRQGDEELKSAALTRDTRWVFALVD